MVKRATEKSLKVLNFKTVKRARELEIDKLHKAFFGNFAMVFIKRTWP